MGTQKRMYVSCLDLIVDMTLHPEVSIALLPGGYLVHTARAEEDDIVQDPHIFSTLEEAVAYATKYFKGTQESIERLEKFII